MKFVLIIALSCVAASQGQILVQQTCDARVVDVEMNGAAAVINGIFSMRLPGTGGYGCGPPAEDQMQIYEAARWTLRNLNNRNFVPGIKIGMKAFDDCATAEVALKAATDAYPQYIAPSNYCTQQTPLNLGILGGLTSDASILMSKFTGKFSGAVVSPRAGSTALSNKNIHPTFLRTAASAKAIATAMVKILERLSWEKILLVHTDTSYGKSGMEEVLDAAYGVNICIAHAVSLKQSSTNLEIQNALRNINQFKAKGAIFFGDNEMALKVLEVLNAQPGLGDIQWMFADLSPSTVFPATNRYVRGSMVVSLKQTQIAEFETYFMSFVNTNSATTTNPNENPWFQDWFKPGYVYTQNFFVDSTIRAVYAYAVALRDAQAGLCGGSSGVCDLLRRMTPKSFHDYLKNVDYSFVAADGMVEMIGERVKFDVNGNPSSSDYTLWNYNDIGGSFKFQQAGEFKDGTITTDSGLLRFYDASRTNALPTAPDSRCPASQCSNCYLPRRELTYSYTPGDISLLSITSTRYPGREPLTCGPISDNGSQNYLAVKYAVQTVKNRFPNILRGVNLGLLLADPCYDSLTAESFVANLWGGRRIYRDSQEKQIDPSLFKAVLQTSTSSVIKRVSHITGMYNVPDVGINPALDIDNKELYPLHTRFHPAHDVIIAAMLETLQRFGWSNVQLVYKNDQYYELLAKELRKRAAMSSICIVSSHMFGQRGTEIVQNLRLLSNQSNVVIVLGYSSDIRSLLGGIQVLNAKDEFVLMSTSWTFDLAATKGFEAEADGSIILTQAVNRNLDFDTYLRQFTMDQIRSDPVISVWYESVHDCFLEPANPNNYRAACTGQSITSSTRYQQKLLVPFTINAVYAIARALDKTLTKVCGPGYNGVCANYRSSGYGKDLFDFLQNDEFTDASGGVANRIQVQDGKLLTDFTIMSYRANQPNAKIADFDTKRRQLSSFNSPVLSAKSECHAPCSQCQYVYQHQPFIYQPGDVLIGGMFSVSNPSGMGPYRCGDIRLTNGFQYTAAMLHALDQVNNGKAPVSLRAGLKVGGLAMDHCNTPIRPVGLLSTLYSGLYDWGWMRYQKMYQGLNPQKISAWMIDTSSASAEAATFLEPLNVPIVSPSATATSLKEVKTFYRTIQGDDATATAILRLSKSLGFNYLQAVGSNNVYGQSGLRTIKSVGFQEEVCVTTSYTIGKDGDYDAIVAALVNGRSDVIVVYLDTSDMIQLVQAKNNNPNALNLTFISPEPFSRALGAGAYDMLSLKLRSPNLDEFRTYLISKTTSGYSENVFFKRYYSELQNCNLPGIYIPGRQSCPDKLVSIPTTVSYRQDNFVTSTMDSVYSVVAAIDATLKQLCGEEYDMVCSAYTDHPNINNVIQQNLNEVSFRDPSGHDFLFQDRDGNIPYEITRYNGAYNKVGDYAGASIRLDANIEPFYSNKVSECTNDCLECVRTGITFTYVPGDVLLGGLFDVHEKSINPFLCGKINTLHGFQLLEAFHYALSLVNAKKGIFANKLEGVTVGGIGLDGCQSPINTGFLVSNIHNGVVSLAKNGDLIDPKKIDAYIGTYSSDSSIYVSRILNDLKIPQISYSSSSTQLKDQIRYPYFYRTIPADDNQAEAIANFLDKYNIRYVQVLYTDTSYGILGSKAFQEAAAKRRICVAQMVSYPDQGSITNEISNDVVTALLQKPVANTVIVFAGSNYINALLQAVGRISGDQSEFKFIGTETWGNNEDAILGVEKYASGSVSLGLETDDLRVFDEYLGLKSPLNSQVNPWFNEYYEEIWNCYLSVPSARHPVKCPQTARSLITSRRYTQDPGILHVINSVFSSAIALDMTLTEVCGPGYTTVCEAYRNRNDRRDVLLEKLGHVNFTDLSEAEFTFKNREGNKGYSLYSVTAQSVTSGYIYKNIGSYNADGELDMEGDYKPDWDGSCERDDACSECPTVRNRGQRYTVLSNPNLSQKTLSLVSVFDIHKIGLDEFRCGEINMDGGFQQYLAFTYTMKNLVRNLDVRGLVLDTCSNNLRVEQDVFNLLANSKLCNSLYSVSPPVHAKSIGGFVVSNDDNTEAAARVLNPLGFSYVSPSSTSIAFNNNNLYSYLLRTIAPRSELLKIIAAIMKEKDWKYVTTFVSFDSDENAAFKVFKEMADKNSVCMGTPVAPVTPMTPKDVQDALKSQYDSSSSRVIVLFTTLDDTRTILMAAKELGYLDEYFWVFTDTWASDLRKLNLPNDMQFSGVAIHRRSNASSSFQEYVSSIMYDASNVNRNSHNIPREWFEEFYQRVHNCRLEDANNPRNINLCTKLEKISKDSPFFNDKYILNTIAATYSIAEGVKKFQKDSCNIGESFVDCVNRRPDARELIRQKTLEVTWVMSNSIKVTGDYEVNFNNQQFWNQGFLLQQINAPSTTMVKAGDWNDDKLENLALPGTWTAKCPRNEEDEELEDCRCPQMAAAAQPQTGSQTSGRTVKIPDPRNYYYYNDGTKLYDWPLWAIVVAVLTCAGLLTSIIVIIYLLIAYPTKGGTSVLGYLATFGIIFIYVLNFAFFFPASLETCTTRRLLMGIVYAIVFGPLLVKAVDNWFRKDSDYAPEQYHGLTSSVALLLMALGIVLIQAIIPIEWLILVRPTATKTFDSGFHDYWWCDPPNEYDVGLVLSMIFVIFLILMTAIFSGLSWDSWRNNYESRWIFIATVCTAGCFFVWMIVVTNAGAPVRDAAVTIGNMVNATALLVCIPLRKMIIACSYSKEKEGYAGEEMLYQNPYEDQTFDPDYHRAGSKQASESGF